MRDVRESTLPADAKTTISIQYESYEKLRKNLRLALEADLATEEVWTVCEPFPRGLFIFVFLQKQLNRELRAR